ncbi:MAG TPA: carboxyl transferase domain-containing protein, partial [Petrotogaceae bacterium]|nr:carboxyl transferase domain-containing protein [Petrotogaceae bacterium]
YKKQFANPYEAAAKGYIEGVIDPATTRAKIAKALDISMNKAEPRPAKKHGNIPL